jgi:hypothetical protein
MVSSRKLLLIITLGAFLIIAGCSTLKDGYHSARALAGKIVHSAQKIAEIGTKVSPQNSGATNQPAHAVTIQPDYTETIQTNNGATTSPIKEATSQPSSTENMPQGTVTSTPIYVPSQKDLAIYKDGVADNWSSWSWGSTINFDNTTPVHSGSKSIAVTYTDGWSALYLHIDEPITSADFTEIRFWVNASKENEKISFKVIDDSNGNWDNGAEILLKANAWIEVTVPLENVGNPKLIGGLVWQEYTGGAQPIIFIDDITLVARKGPPPPTATPSTGPSLNVDVQADRHTISPLVYGMSFASEDQAKELHIPVNRSGGNGATTYNWQIDVHNSANDWFYENIPDESVDPAKLPDGSTIDQFIEQNQRTGTQSILTIPMIGWTPKRRLADHPYDCSFKVSKYGTQQNTDQYDSDCGNGVNANGKVLTGNNPTDAYKKIDETFVQSWINYLIGKYGTADKGGVTLYNLDNEPMLWNSTHRDIHPNPVTFDELRDLTYKYAAAIKAVDPKAQTLGPVFWGWCAYFYSAADDCKVGPDYIAHGGMDLTPWYLQQMHQYEQKNNVRILDYLDLHIYPQEQGVYGDKGNTATQELRLRSTRALWDRTYSDESWIGQPIYLIPRMHEWVDKYYPGTKLALTEYSWGDMADLNGALAQADILGIFGREKLDLATLWWTPSLDQPGAYAFRMYRNYDGKGAAFGETGVKAVSDNQDQLSVYAAQRDVDHALTLIVINKTSGGLISSVSYSNFTAAATAKVYRYSADNLKAIVQQPDLALTSTSFSMNFPANSITLIVIPQK